MIIYLAATAPGNEINKERKFLSFQNRLLSYFLITEKKMECDSVFLHIKKHNKTHKR